MCATRSMRRSAEQPGAMLMMRQQNLITDLQMHSPPPSHISARARMHAAGAFEPSCASPTTFFTARI
jgi:hypothetical protein